MEVGNPDQGSGSSDWQPSGMSESEKKHIRKLDLDDECNQLELLQKRKRAPLIAFEGIDKAGKTTQFKKVVSKLDDYLRFPYFVSFPRLSTSTGRILERYLNNDLVLDDAVVHHLFSANRWEQRDQIVGDIKLCNPVVVDRYVASGRAYTLAKGRFDLEWIRQFDKGLPKPDLTIWLDGDARELANRPGYGQHQLENLHFQMKVQEAFGSLMEEGWVKIIVDGRSETEIFTEIMTHVDRVLCEFTRNEHLMNYY